MEKKVASFVAFLILILTIFGCFLLLYFPNMHALAMKYEAEKEQRKTHRESVMTLLKDNSKDLENILDLSKGQLRIQVPNEITADSVTCDMSYVDKTLHIVIPHADEAYFNDYPMLGACDNINDLYYDTDSDNGYIDVVLDKVLEYEVLRENGYIYLNFVDPHEIYDSIVVIDAGHGSRSPGATKQGIREKDVDLSIVLELKKILDKDTRNIGVYYTRQDDTNPSFANRVGLANDINADLFLSIHNNSTASGRMSSINGTQVMYLANDSSGKSMIFADNCLQELLSALGSRNKGLVVGDEIYIIRMSKVPVALVEVGFMTNQEELLKLNTPEYQKKAAQGLYQAIIKTLEENDE